MKNSILLLLTLFLLSPNIFAQSDVLMRSEYGSDDIDLQSVLRFEDISMEILTFSNSNLKGKDYLITIKDFVNGKLMKTDVAFDSKEDPYFKIREDKLVFRVLTKVTSENTVKFDFQFNGFSKRKEYKVAANHKEFATKNFLGSKSEVLIPLDKSNYILTYMMPYQKKDGSKQYCEVVQSGVNPEELGKKYAIPRYFLIDIKFQ